MQELCKNWGKKPEWLKTFQEVTEENILFFFFYDATAHIEPWPPLCVASKTVYPWPLKVYFYLLYLGIVWGNKHSSTFVSVSPYSQYFTLQPQVGSLICFHLNT
jgi:hypothetical protein